LSVTSYVGFRTSTQPTNIKQLPKYDFSKRNPTNHVAGVFVQALIKEQIWDKVKTVLWADFHHPSLVVNVYNSRWFVA
jgi:hypothetical protein